MYQSLFIFYFFLIPLIQCVEKLLIANITVQLENLPNEQDQTSDKIRNLLQNVTDLKKMVSSKQSRIIDQVTQLRIIQTGYQKKLLQEIVVAKNEKELYEKKLKYYFQPKFNLLNEIDQSLQEMINLLNHPEKAFVDNLFNQQSKFIESLTKYSFYIEPADGEVDKMDNQEFQEMLLNSELHNEDLNYLKSVLYDLCQLKTLQYIDFSQTSIEFMIEIKKSIEFVKDLVIKSVDALSPSIQITKNYLKLYELMVEEQDEKLEFLSQQLSYNQEIISQDVDEIHQTMNLNNENLKKIDKLEQKIVMILLKSDVKIQFQNIR